MEKKGILYCAEVNDSDIVLTGHHTSLTGLSRNLRDRLETVIEKSPLKLETRKFLISILLGDRSYLDLKSGDNSQMPVWLISWLSAECMWG